MKINAIVTGDLPTYAHPGDAGMDLYATHGFYIMPFDRAVVGTGVSLAIPEGVVGLIHPRSGLASQRGITVLNAPGTIDSGYRGEIKVILHNPTPHRQQLEAGERIAQLVFQRYLSVELSVVDSLDDTVRGHGGFGSSGK